MNDDKIRARMAELATEFDALSAKADAMRTDYENLGVDMSKMQGAYQELEKLLTVPLTPPVDPATTIKAVPEPVAKKAKAKS